MKKLGNFFLDEVQTGKQTGLVYEYRTKKATDPQVQKEQNYELKDDKMYLTFNEYILDNLEEKNILEEVIYSIGLSVMDNYKVKDVVFLINGEEIVKSVVKTLE